MGSVSPRIHFYMPQLKRLSEHPYFDPKTNKEEPTWYMVSVKFLSRLPHPPSLALIKFLASSSTIPDEVNYIGEGGYQAVKEMQLVNRGRLSMSYFPFLAGGKLMKGVQPVTEEAYEAVVQLGTQGGWEGLVIKPGKAKAKAAKVKDEPTDETVKKGPAAKKEKIKKATVKKEAIEDEKPEEKVAPKSKKRNSIKAEVIKEEPTEGTRRSKRVKDER